MIDHLKKLVSIEGETGIKATGVPPHVHILKGNAILKQQMLGMVECLHEQTNVIVKSVEDSILQNDVCSGILSLNTLKVTIK